MSTTRPPALHIGDRVQFEDAAQTVVGLSGTLVRLAAEDGRTSVVHLPHLLADPRFEHLGGHTGARLPAGLLDGLAEEVVEEACWWEQHIVEVLTGIRPDAPPGTPPRPDYDPATRTLHERDQAKAQELAAEGRVGVSLRTVERKRQRYQVSGLVGLVDRRHDRAAGLSGRTDSRVLTALAQAIEEASDQGASPMNANTDFRRQASDYLPSPRRRSG
ncbi:hypothetical protein Misp01_83480 [Microtetraspora sp. NBRC 13810]|uniref:hypothetical protein n=1 Tax=Microtetraspora sp. NBRC 13810 TaxID=3030990 RepID=UPI0024A03CD2|nr:hypothetical protein [Microtetraspora sp. NBRC 13810]GLW13220.1 hypothetical protein Misp01_83480 [Microtetraspora sp. NBRC 13810]